MPATSFSGVSFSAALLQRPRRLAFEVEDVEVPLGPEHLAEVIVAVDAGLAPLNSHRLASALSWRRQRPRRATRTVRRVVGDLGGNGVAALSAPAARAPLRLADRVRDQRSTCSRVNGSGANASAACRSRARGAAPPVRRPSSCALSRYPPDHVRHRPGVPDRPARERLPATSDRAAASRPPTSS